MDKVKEALAKNTGLFDPLGSQITFINDLSKSAGVNPGAPVFFVFMLTIIFMTYAYGWLILVTALTIIYPSLRSIRAIQTPEGADDKTWLTYWMVFGTFVVLETFVGFLLEMLPYWHMLRMVFFIWLLLPYFNGAEVLYTKVMKPLLSDNKDKIQDLIKKTQTAATAGVAEATKKATDPSLISAAISGAAQAQSKLAEVSEQAKIAEVANNVE